MSRLAVVTREGLMLHAGRRRPVPVDPGPVGGLVDRTPTWSPDGRRLAWAAFDRRQPGMPSYLAVADAGGGDRVDLPVTFPVCYLQWRPDGGALASVAEGPLGLELSVVPLDGGAPRVLSRGTPLRFDWSPTGAVAVHVGQHDPHLEILEPDGPGVAAATAGAGPEGFGAPAWLDDDHLVAVHDHDRRRILAVLDRRLRVQRGLAEPQGPAGFAPSPDRTRLAWCDARGLVVTELATGAHHQVVDRPVAAMGWSPDGRHLLCATVHERGEPPALAWSVHPAEGDGAARRLAVLRPSTTLARFYLPLADQHARSLSWWSPRSDAVCVAGSRSSEPPSVWIHPLDGAPPQRIPGGELAMFAPAAPDLPHPAGEEDR